jgi:hypothetical protein
MNIKIGNNNKIKNSVIGKSNIKNKEGETQKHPIITALATSFVIGFIFLFSFWKDVVSYIEHFFK